MIRKISLAATTALSLTAATTIVSADTVLYSDNPNNPAYDDVRNTLIDVYGTDDLNSGVFSESTDWAYQIQGTGDVEVPFTFLYDDGMYEFEFGYFYVTDSLLDLPYDSVAEKQAWTEEALSTAQVVLVDRNSSAPAGAVQVQTDPDDLYTSASNDAYRDQSDYNPINTNTVTLQGGSVISFFLIPNNTLENFLDDSSDGTYSDFGVGSTGSSSWPLFTFSGANPGSNSDGSGEGLDQAFEFDGTSRTTTGDALPGTNNDGYSPNAGKMTTTVAWEDITRRGGSDNDFQDLMFTVGNVAPVPEASTVIAGFLLIGSLLVFQFRMRKSRNKS